MGDSVTAGSDHNPETEATEDTNNGKDKEIWKESLVDAAGNLVDKEDKVEEVEKGEEKEDEEKSPPGIKPELQYSRDELYEIQKVPLSQIKPEFLADFPIQAKFSFVKGVWEAGAAGAPPPRERWPRSVTPNEHDGYNDNKMRRGDGNRMPRGKDGQQDPNFILSPQRRSFNSGCYMTGGNNPMGARDGKVMDRDSMGQSQGRRSYGSGDRGPVRAMPWSDPSGGGPEASTFVAPNLMPDYTQRRDPPPLLSQPVGSMFDRMRGYGGDKYENKRQNNRNNGDYNGRNNGDYTRNGGGDYGRNGGDYNNRNDYGNGRYNGMNGNDRRQRNNSDRHQNHSDMWDEPEWFAEPTTQNDVIELRGFLDDDRDGSSPEKNRKSSSNSTSESEREHRKSSSSSSGGLDKLEQRPPSAEERSAQPGNPSKLGPGEPNLDDVLNNLDNLPDMLSNGTAAGTDSHSGGSRFSRWFRKESPVPDNNSPSPHHMINDLINEITDENRPPNVNRFSPISPVFSNQQPHRPLHSNSTSNFLDMMMKGQDGTGGIMRSGSIRDLEGVGKLHSVEELEAKMRPNSVHPSHPHAGNKEEDMANFKKLLAKSIDSKKPPPDALESPIAANLGTSDHIEPPHTDQILPNMMSKILQQQQLAQSLQQGVHQLPPGVAGPWGSLLAAQSNSNYQDLVQRMVKIQQAQEYQRRMASLGLSSNPTPGIPPELQHHLLNNPQFDARNLVRSTVGAGPLSPNQQSQPPPHPLSPGGPNFLQPAGPVGGLLGQVPPTQAAQQFMLGATNPGAAVNPPGTNPVFQQRIPSPNQLAAHTQSILQNAIMKKKMEEQKEALRKRQELLQRAASPGAPNYHHHHQPGSNIMPTSGHDLRPSNASPVIAAFTPTSVLRKMTAAHPQEQQEKDMLLNQNHSHGQAGHAPWSKPQPPSSLAHKNNLINLGNQQIPGQPQMSNPRSKFTLSSKQGTKSSGHLVQSLADQVSMMSQELNMKSPAQHTGNPFTSHLPSHHSQAGGPQVMEQLEKWFSPELLARAQAQAPLPAQNILSVEELERLASRGNQAGRPNPNPGAVPSAEAVQH